MITEYVMAAMRYAEFEVLEDGTVYGEIPDAPGVWSEGITLEDSREELKEVLREWIDIRLARDLPIPAFDGISVKELI